MTRYGFLIDQDTCIGCHACTVACKAEHDVPVGVNRTWVKYIESGAFPNTRRQFSVMRCNHCDDAPCVAICPTTALFQRPDGIVDFDTKRCIGCKSCMNACPYDAIYIDPDDHTAQKCNFCAHRVETGLAPSCVVVCPTQSIVAGDLDDPASHISRMVARHDVAVRAPEQGTRPKVFYKGADQASLDPTRTAIARDGMIWADTTPHHPTVRVDDDGQVARTAYTTMHPTPWGWMVSAYLVTKSIGAGVMLLAALLVLLGHADDGSVRITAPVIAGAFTALTGALLVADLKQPRRFHYIITKPNWSSWLTRGAFVLGAFAAVMAAWFVAGLAGVPGVIQALAIPAALLAAGTAGYTAFLFGQCEGRDLWQTPLLLPTLLAQAVTTGAAAFVLVDVVAAVPEIQAVRWALVGGVAAQALFVFTEVSGRSSRSVELAVRAMTRGDEAARFWGGGVMIGMVAPAGAAVLAISGVAPAALGALAGVTAVIGLAAYEDAFVRAGQSVPLS